MDVITLARALVAALITLIPHSPALTCIRARSERIAAAIASAQTDRGVPAALMLSTGFMETFDGCARNEGGGWGAPRDFQHRHIAGTADDAARVLSNGYRHCGSWPGAVHWFRSGLCASSNAVHAEYTHRVIRFAGRLSTAAGAAAIGGGP
jgi:hypothetical protein